MEPVKRTQVTAQAEGSNEAAAGLTKGSKWQVDDPFPTVGAQAESQVSGGQGGSTGQTHGPGHSPRAEWSESRTLHVPYSSRPPAQPLGPGDKNKEKMQLWSPRLSGKERRWTG